MTLHIFQGAEKIDRIREKMTLQNFMGIVLTLHSILQKSLTLQITDLEQFFFRDLETSQQIHNLGTLQFSNQNKMTLLFSGNSFLTLQTFFL